MAKIYKTIVSFVLYGCEMWSLILWEVVGLRQVTRKIPGPSKHEVSEEFRICNDALCGIYWLRNVVRMVKYTERWACS
jgi:hypothetical protein